MFWSVMVHCMEGEAMIEEVQSTHM